MAGRSLTSEESSPTGLLGLSLSMNPDMEPLPAIINNDQAGGVQILLDDQTMLVTHAPLHELGWTPSVAVPLSELTTELDAVSRSICNDGRTTVRITLLAMTRLYFMAILFSVSFSYRYRNRPLRQLLQGVRAVTSGELYVTVPVISQDELGERLNYSTR